MRTGDIVSGQVKTNDQKFQWWTSIQDRLLASYEVKLKADAINQIEYDMLCGELKGGMKCKQCGMAWMEVRFNNPFGMGLYYRPACGCAPRCLGCRRRLHVEYSSGNLMGEEWCNYCGAPLTPAAMERYNEAHPDSDGQIRRQIIMRKSNWSGEKCACGHDLWYERKSDSIYCQICRRRLPDVQAGETGKD
jgi:hypothetical protein